MSTSDKRRDVATKATSANAVPGLQEMFDAALQRAEQRTRSVEVSLVGPGASSKPGEYPPQVRETLSTMVARQKSSTLHVHYYKDPHRPTQDRYISDPETGSSVRVVHHDIDLTAPKAGNTQADVVVATRVVAPVMRDVQHAGEAKYKSDIAARLREEGKPTADFVVDFGASAELSRHRADVFRKQAFVSGGRDQSSPGVFRLAPPTPQSAPAENQRATPRRSTTPPASFRAFNATATSTTPPIQTAALSTAVQGRVATATRHDAGVAVPKRSTTPTTTRSAELRKQSAELAKKQ
jgi:hypothetical protein